MNRTIKAVISIVLCLAIIASLIVGLTFKPRVAKADALPSGNYSLVVTLAASGSTPVTYPLTATRFDANGNGVYLKENLNILGAATMYVIDADNSDARVPLSGIAAANAGTYNVTFTKYENGTGGTTTLNRTTADSMRYFVLGSFNNYTADLGATPTDLTYYGANRMRYNPNNLTFDEYVLENYTVNDSDTDFYIGVYDLSGNQTSRYPVSVKYDLTSSGEYNFYYAPSYDYGYDNKVKYELLRNLDDEGTVYIKTVEEFNEFAKKCSVDTYADNKTVVLQADLDFTGKEFNAIGVFGGKFLGGNHTLSGIKISGKGSYFGVFRYVKAGGAVEKLNVNAEITALLSQIYLGGIAGSNSGLIKDCSFYGKVYGNTYIGGIVGVNEKVADDASTEDDNDANLGFVLNGAIVNCVNYATVDGYGNIGGIAGMNRGTIFNSENRGIINNVEYSTLLERTIVNIGGIAGYSVGSGARVQFCRNYSTVGFKESGSFVGGIVGMGLSAVTESENYGEVYSDEYSGGIVGFYANVRSEEAAQSIDDIYRNYIEQIFGDYEGQDDTENLPEAVTETVSAELSLSANYGKITANRYAGGVLGYMSTSANVTLSVHSSFNEGEVYAKNGTAGGVIGWHASGTLKRLFNIGEVKVKDDASYAGGIAGLSAAIIDACYSISDVTGKSYVGGIVGSGYTVIDCYSNSSVKASGQNAGSIAGYVSGRCETCYYVKTDVGGIDGISYTYKAEGLDPLEMASTDMLPVKMVGFDGEDYLGGAVKLHYPALKAFAECDSERVGDKFKERSDYSTLLSYKLVFFDEEEKAVATIRVYYNSDVPKSEIPNAPVKAGYYVTWEEFKTENIVEDQKIHAVYVKGLSAIATDESVRPTLFAEGAFHPDTKLVLTENFFGDVTVLGSSVYKSYKVSASLNGKEISIINCKVKALIPEGMNNVKIVLITADGYQKQTAVQKGDYLEFMLDGTSEFMITYTPSLLDGSTWVYAVVAFVIGCVLAALVAVAIHFIRKKRQSRQDEEKTDNKEKSLEEISEKDLSQKDKKEN